MSAQNRLQNSILVVVSFMAKQQWNQKCCNPFQKENHDWKTRQKSLRIVSDWMCEKCPSISLELKICDACRKQLYQLPDPTMPSELESSEPDSAESSYTMHKSLELSPIN